MNATSKTQSIPLSSKKAFVQVLKGAVIGVIISLILVLLFALIIKLTDISDSVITPINQIIKILSIFIGVYFALKNSYYSGMFKGILVGLFYTVLSFLVFSALDGTFVLDTSFVNDLLFGGITGAISGIILVNLKRNYRVNN
ncbi:MAG: TIGR04086 family membrane protein [Clostridia bacterium]|jgi:putative membrane protein (TIGR04086 family)|nr:TIGR04086 family membrane protein [Clostridia bacterium]MDD4275465.1 TIGR04086 family membrane protein [Clostridia bacterium]